MSESIRSFLEGNHSRRPRRSTCNGSRKENRLPGRRRVRRRGQAGRCRKSVDLLHQGSTCRGEAGIAAITRGDNVVPQGSIPTGQVRSGHGGIPVGIQGNIRRQGSCARGKVLVGEILKRHRTSRSRSGSRRLCYCGSKSHWLVGYESAYIGRTRGEGHVDPSRWAKGEERSAIQRVDRPIGTDQAGNVRFAESRRKGHSLGKRIGGDIPTIETAIFIRHKDAVRRRVHGSRIDAPLTHGIGKLRRVVIGVRRRAYKC